MEAIYLRGYLESKGPLDLSVYVCSLVEGDIEGRLLSKDLVPPPQKKHGAEEPL